MSNLRHDIHLIHLCLTVHCTQVQAVSPAGQVLVIAVTIAADRLVIVHTCSKVNYIIQCRLA